MREALPADLLFIYYIYSHPHPCRRRNTANFTRSPLPCSISSVLSLSHPLLRLSARARGSAASFRVTLGDICIRACKRDTTLSVCMQRGCKCARTGGGTGANTYVDIPARPRLVNCKITTCPLHRRLRPFQYRGDHRADISSSRRVISSPFSPFSFFFPFVSPDADPSEFYFQTFSLYRCILRYADGRVMDATVISRVCELPRSVKFECIIYV